MEKRLSRLPHKQEFAGSSPATASNLGRSNGSEQAVGSGEDLENLDAGSWHDGQRREVDRDPASSGDAAHPVEVSRTEGA